MYDTLSLTIGRGCSAGRRDSMNRLGERIPVRAPMVPDSSLTSAAENSAHPANNSAGLDAAKTIDSGLVAKSMRHPRGAGIASRKRHRGNGPWVNGSFNELGMTVARPLRDLDRILRTQNSGTATPGMTCPDFSFHVLSPARPSTSFSQTLHGQLRTMPRRTRSYRLRTSPQKLASRSTSIASGG
jgi:hypothetical protein